MSVIEKHSFIGSWIFFRTGIFPALYSTSISIYGQVVEYSPSTRSARFRFPGIKRTLLKPLCGMQGVRWRDRQQSYNELRRGRAAPFLWVLMSLKRWVRAPHGRVARQNSTSYTNICSGPKSQKKNNTPSSQNSPSKVWGIKAKV